jgi:hypothetical protein
MTRIAVTGHRNLTPEVAAAVDDAIRAQLASYGRADLVGISCLAQGADQIFARAVLDRGGQLEVVVPAAGYRDAMSAPERAGFDELVARARAVHRLAHATPTAQAHMDASVAAIARADRLFAVWDGRPARSYGGTADVVDHAHAVGVTVTVIWPVGAERD